MSFERTIIHKKTYIDKFSLKKHDLATIDGSSQRKRKMRVQIKTF